MTIEEKLKVRLPTFIRKCKKCTCGLDESQILDIKNNKIVRVNSQGTKEEIDRSSYIETEQNIKEYEKKLKLFLKDIKKANKKSKKFLKIVKDS